MEKVRFFIQFFLCAVERAYLRFSSCDYCVRADVNSGYCQILFANRQFYFFDINFLRMLNQQYNANERERHLLSDWSDSIL